jgi:hypothetical protein
MTLIDMQKRTVKTGEEEAPWQVCTAHKWHKADWAARRELYDKYGQPAVLDVLRSYATAKTAGHPLPPLANPRDLLFNWRGMVAALAACVVPSMEALRLVGLCKYTPPPQAIEGTMQAYARWSALVPTVQARGLVAVLQAAIVDRLQPPGAFAHSWHDMTVEPWAPSHRNHEHSMRLLALRVCGESTPWFILSRMLQDASKNV